LRRFVDVPEREPLLHLRFDRLGLILRTNALLEREHRQSRRLGNAPRNDAWFDWLFFSGSLLKCCACKICAASVG